MANPLVSILIPAYNERYFAETFESARAQQGVDLEIVVCDDSPGEAIGRVVAAAGDPRVRYLRNPKNLGFAGNFTQCYQVARGAFLKFLNDDDRLRAGCVAMFASILNNNPGVKLATSRRIPIDARGQRLPDGPATAPISQVSAIMAGRELGDYALVHSMNFIGEPTTVMFRRADVTLEDGLLFRWGGRDYHCLADMSLWLRLMANGLAYYTPAPFSEFRVHEGQEQNREGVRLSCLTERVWILRHARSAGYLGMKDAQRVAFANLRARLQAWLDRGAFTPAESETVRGLLVELDEEAASLR
jgi:glycosyltransferase involved in cell wall biosynthesis